MQSPLVSFIDVLRSHDVRISPAETLDAMHAMSVLGYDDREHLRIGLATTLASLLPRLALYLEQQGFPRIPLLFNLFNTYLLSPIVSYATFTLFYKFLPAARVSWRPALWGGLLTVLLWEGARLLFSRFLALSYGFGLLSGSLAAIVGFLLWTYTGMAILLLGAELASILNGRGRPSDDSGDAFIPAGVS